MIKNIELNGVATFKNTVNMKPSLINYIYGFNGSGKTTLSNVLKKPELYTNCIVEKDNEEMKVLVYNKEFVDGLFKYPSTLKGIFTLGKDSGETLKIIDESKERLKSLRKNNDELGKTLEMKNIEKNYIEENIKESCWNIRNKVYNSFQRALKGYVGNKEIFKNKCLETKINKDNIKKMEELQKNYDLLFSKERQKKEEISLISSTKIRNIENNNIFKEIIKGNNETTVSELINKLNNGDWVKRGLEYLKKAESKCPFCQQEVTQSLFNHLSEYFDKDYENKCKIISDLKDEYKFLSSKLLSDIDTIIKSKFENDEEIKTYYEQLKLLIEQNIKNIEQKINKPSDEVMLKSSDEVFTKINNKIVELNKIINENNEKIANLSREQEKFKSELWNYIVNELNDEILSYKKDKENIDKAIMPITLKISNNKNEIEKLGKRIKENEKKITGITQSLIEINKILKSFGFEGFLLEEGTMKGTYKVVRKDGTDVGSSLSEGEYRFISFLYYYCLISGSYDETGVIKDKILVIDDPISSLDSNSLFIVSTLVKKLVNECFENKNGIKQIFILTHNLYFYKEVIYRGSRDNKKESKEKYFVISKKNEISNIKEYEESPVKTSYQLLWEELKDEPINKNTCCNTMRRILEYYFNIVGNQNYEKTIDEFEGTDKLLCKSLLSFINDSSHYISDDINIVIDDDMIKKYKEVFKKIFEKMGHINHYNMMMGE